MTSVYYTQEWDAHPWKETTILINTTGKKVIVALSDEVSNMMPTTGNVKIATGPFTTSNARFAIREYLQSEEFAKQAGRVIYGSTMVYTSPLSDIAALTRDAQEAVDNIKSTLYSITSGRSSWHGGKG